MNIIDRKINVPKFLFYMSYFLLITQSMTRWVNNIEGFRSICSTAIPLLLFFSILLQVNKYTKNNILLMMFLLIISFFSFYVSKDIAIFYIILFLMASKSSDFNGIIKFDLAIKLCLLCLVFFLYSIGMTEKVISYTVDRGVRYAFGFGHPNTLGVYVFSICADLAYLNYKNRKLIIYMFLAIAAILINIYCDSRGSFISIILLIILSYLLPKLKNSKVFKGITIYMFPLLLIVSYLVSYLFMKSNGNSVFIFLDELFSRRISLMAAFLDGYSIHLFGSKFINYNTGTIGTSYVLDSAYMSLLIKFGLAVTLFFAIAMPKKVKKAYNSGQYNIILCLIVFMFFGLMENGFYVLAYNPFLLSLATIIFKNNVGGEVNEN